MSHRGERALVRKRLDEVVAWEHEVSVAPMGLLASAMLSCAAV